MIPVAQGFQIAIAVLTALPGAAAALKALLNDIAVHPDLTSDEKAKLLALKKHDVDAEDDRVQAVDLPPPAPITPS